MERSTYHHGDLPAALVAAGLGLLRSEGADQISLRAVARAAGVSPNAPYRHFADKDDLLAALVSHGCAELRAGVETVTGGSVTDRIAGVVLHGVRFARDNPQMFRLMTAHVCCCRPVAVTALAEVRAAVGRVLREPGAPGPEPEEDALFTGVWALTQGLCALLVDDLVRPAPGESVDAYVTRVVRATTRAYRP